MIDYENLTPWQAFARNNPKKASAIESGWGNFHTARLQVSVLLLLCQHKSGYGSAQLAVNIVQQQLELSVYKAGVDAFKEREACKN